MKCFTSYARFNADTINGETLVVTQRYTTFDSIEMDAFEDGVIRPRIGSGVVTEFEPYKAESEDLGDYPDIIHNQFDNMTGSMNL